MKIVINASPIIFLAKLERLSWLEGFELFLPKIVEQELFIDQRPEQDLIRNFFAASSVPIVDPKKDKRLDYPPNLGAGEKAVISLALGKKIRVLVLDDHQARMIARSLKLRTKGTLGLLLDQVQKKNITKEQGRQFLQKLLKAGFRISEDLLLTVFNALEGNGL
jgi:predicted nucleic acid-binding protein